MDNPLFVIVVFCTVLSLAILLVRLLSGKPRAKQQLIDAFLKPPLMRYGEDPRKYGSWLNGNWYVGERLNDTINAGKGRAAKPHPRKRRG